MRFTISRRTAVRWFAGVLLVVTIGAAQQSSLAGPTTARSVSANVAAPEWDTFDADVTVTVTRFDAKGKQLPWSGRPTHFHVQHSRVGTSSNTVTSAKPELVTVHTLTGTRQIPSGPGATRVEDRGDGSSPAIHGRNRPTIDNAHREKLLDAIRKAAPGHPLVQDRPAPQPRKPRPHGTHESFVFTASERNRRRNDLEKKYGPAQGAVRGYARYLKTVGGTTTEILVDPETEAPVEINSAINGRLISQATYSYSIVTGIGKVQTSVRLKRLINEQGARSITETTMTNVAFSRKGGGQ